MAQLTFKSNFNYMLCMQVQRVLKLKMWQFRGMCLTQTHTKARDADKALPVSELLYKEKKRNNR